MLNRSIPETYPDPFAGGYEVAGQTDGGLHLIGRRLTIDTYDSRDMAWSSPDAPIHPDQALTVEEEQNLLRSTLQGFEKVPDRESNSSSCTDGRHRIKLMDGEDIPVRPQYAGASLGMFHHVAKTLDLVDNKLSAREQVRWSAKTLKEELGYRPCTHIGCAACALHTPIRQKIATEFGQNELFIARKQALLPNGVFDRRLHEEMITESEAQLNRENEVPVFEDFLAAAGEFGTGHAIAILVESGNGYHGHTERGIVRGRAFKYAINERHVALLTGGDWQHDADGHSHVDGGEEVFGQNDIEMWEMAARIADRFGKNPEDCKRLFQRAVMAMEDWTSGTHGTVARELPTWVIEKAKPTRLPRVLARYLGKSGLKLPT